MFKKRIIYIFIFSFVFSFIFQRLPWKDSPILDGEMWQKQAVYFETGDNRQFDYLRAYGHPGGPIIESELIFNKLFDPGHKHSESFMILFLTIFNSLVIGGACILCYILRKNNLWWVIALVTLSMSRFYDFATPPTAIVTPLIIFLSLLALYIYENKEKIKIKHILLWSLFAGLTMATRFDIGGFCVAAFFILFLVDKVFDRKKLYIMAVGSIASFVFFDPYMHFMPFQHFKDLVFKVVFHYGYYAPQVVGIPVHMPFSRIYLISIFAFTAMILTIISLFLRKKIKLPMPFGFIVMLLTSTIILYTVFLTASLEAERYFQPIITIWEVFLPLFIFPFLPKIFLSFNENKKQKIVAISLIFLQTAMFLLEYHYIIVPKQ